MSREATPAPLPLPSILGDMESPTLSSETVRTLVDLVEIDGKLLSVLAPTEEDLKRVPGLAQLLAQRLYLLEKLERE